MDLVATGIDGSTFLLRANGTWRRQDAEPVDAGHSFRRSWWGASKAQVMAGELASLEHQDDAGLLVYSATLGARPMSIFYIFVGDKLVRAKYVLAETYVNAMNYVSAGDELRDSVTKKYGEPKEHNEFWSGDLYRDHPAEKGMAVLAGELSIFTSWTSGDTQITLAVTGENYEANVSLEYMSRQFAQLEDDFRSAAILDDL